jgi:hypothetical protein
MRGLLRHKSSDNTATTSQNASTDTSGILLESSTQLSNFSANPVDTKAFEIPAGYKQVTSPMQKH